VCLADPRGACSLVAIAVVALYEVALTIGMLAASLINTALQSAVVATLLHQLLPTVDFPLWRLMLG
jgi:hypothetical protein